jgi:hypothetical protein
MPTKCSNVISLKQYGETCWFNAILMAVLYSDKSRKLLLKKSKAWNEQIEVLNTIKYILHHKYLRTDKIHNDYAYFDKIRPEYILSELYKYNNKKFTFNSDAIKSGYTAQLYIRKIYKFLGVSVLFVDKIGDDLYYSLYNNTKILNLHFGEIYLKYEHKSIETINRKSKNPDVIIVNFNDPDIDIANYPSWYKLDGAKYKTILDSIKNGEDNINYENNLYINDSILLSNYNSAYKGGHAIAGITCRGDRYVYNGWTRTTIDKNITNLWIKYDYKGEVSYENPSLNIRASDEDLPKDAIVILAKDEDQLRIPCELMKFDWDPFKEKDFCLNTNDCILETMNIHERDLCFSFNKGRRSLIYVKKHKRSDSSFSEKTKTSDSSSSEKKCSSGKVVNPLSDKCVSIKTINKLPTTSLSRPEKVSPEGKVINPNTGRYITIASMNKLLKKVSPTKVSPTKVSPKKVSPKKVSPTKISPTKVSPNKSSP